MSSTTMSTVISNASSLFENNFISVSSLFLISNDLIYLDPSAKASGLSMDGPGIFPDLPEEHRVS